MALIASIFTSHATMLGLIVLIDRLLVQHKLKLRLAACGDSGGATCGDEWARNRPHPQRAAGHVASAPFRGVFVRPACKH